MCAAYRDVLVEELTAAHVTDAAVRSRHHADHEPVPEPPGGSWPLYTDIETPPGAQHQ